MNEISLHKKSYHPIKTKPYKVQSQVGEILMQPPPAILPFFFLFLDLDESPC